MPDYLAPFLQQLSHGTQVIQQLKQQALQQEQIKFEREQQLRQNAIQDRQMANADIGNLQHIRDTARDVPNSGAFDAPSLQQQFDPITGNVTGSTPMRGKIAVDPARTATYRMADGSTRRFELMTPEEVTAKRMADLQAATQIKMLPTIYKEGQENQRLGVKESGQDRRLGAELQFKGEQGEADRGVRADVAKIGAKSREAVAGTNATSRLGAAKISADARRDSAAMGASAGLSAAQIGVQGRFDEGKANNFRKQVDDAEREIQELHAKKLQAGQSKYPKDKYSDPVKAREAVLSGLDGQIRAAEAKRASAQAGLQSKSERVQLRNPAAEQQAKAAPKVTSRAQIEAFAKQRGVSVDQAIAQAKREGFEVR
jgi:hypothetical protein